MHQNYSNGLQKAARNKHMLGKLGTIMLLSIGATTALITEASAAFIGLYDTLNWTTQNTNTGPDPGDVNRSGAPDSIVITGGNSQNNSSGNVDFTIAVAATGTWSFNWSYYSLDINDSGDQAGYLLNGAYTSLASNLDVNNAEGAVSGSSTISVSQGNTIGWRVNTTDNNSFAGQLTISNFNAPTTSSAAVPFEFSPVYGTLLIGAWYGMGELKKYRRSRQSKNGN